MRRFGLAGSVRLGMPAGPWLDAWVAESFGARLLGLAFLGDLPPGRALLVPRCRSVHTLGMRFRIDVAFLSWPPAGGGCEALAVRRAVQPRSVVAPGGLPRGAAALEARAGALCAHGLRPGAWLSVR